MFTITGDVEPDYTPFISMQTFTNTLSDFDGSVSELNALVDKFYFNRIPTETFFQSLPITDNFFFCVIVQNELNDEIIENTEELVFSLMTGNSSDVFVTTNSSIAFATVSVFDNDGRYNSAISARIISVLVSVSHCMNSCRSYPAIQPQ